MQWLLDYLAQAVARGERFSAGDSLQVGWMATIVQAGPGGTLCVTEPDMRSIPIAFVDAVDRTLAHLRSQGDIVASIEPAREPVFASLRQTAVVHVDYRTSGSILLSRFEPQGARSGWWFSDCEGEDDAQDPTRFTTISLYRLALDRPELVKLFALPPGLQVFVEGTRIHVIDDDGELIALPGSFLDRLQQRPLAG